MSVSRETQDRLTAYHDLLRRWNRTVNLVTPGDLGVFNNRHLADSEQISSLANPTANWTDLGSGGGLPGIVVAIHRREGGALHTLIEADRRKATFLRECARQLDLRVRVIAERIESTEPTGDDVVSARALAPLIRLLPWVARHLASDGFALLPKGVRWQEEVDAALAKYDFRLQTVSSVTRPEAAILRIDRIEERHGSNYQRR